MSDTLETDEFDLKDAWEKTCKSFAETHGVDLTKGQKLSPEDIVEQIKVMKDKDDIDNAKHEVAKKFLSSSLKFIQNIGAVAAQGAGMAFGGSKECFNAVSYLITVGQNYRHIISSLADLFDRISHILERFRIYSRVGDMVDVALKKIICLLLLSFVRICELSVKVLKNKVKTFVKVLLFNDDAGINAELENLKTIAENEGQMRGTLIYESVMKNERNNNVGFARTNEMLSGVKSDISDFKGGVKGLFDKMAESDKMREVDMVAKKQLEAIKIALDDSKETYQAIHTNHMSTKVPNTGQWLQKDPFFVTWADRRQVSEPILCISGNGGYGKSYLISTIVQLLKKRYFKGQEDAARTLIAYYYIQKDAKGSQQSDKDLPSLFKALRALAYQIAPNDPVYRKDLAASCKDLEEVSEVHQLWKRLFLDCAKTDATFFILLDGIDQIEEQYDRDLLQILNDIQTMAKGKGLLRVRLLLSGRVDRMEKIMNKLETPVLTIDVASKNGEDVAIFVRHWIDRMGIFSVPSTQVTSLKDEILTGLTKEAKGDFINVTLLLKEIGTMRRPAEIRTVLDKAKAGEKRSDTITREINRCNDVLGDDDIQDLNELLTWLIHSYRDMTLGELQAVLYMKNGESSLRPLQDQIQTQYSAFFRISIEPDTPIDLDTKVMLVSDSIKDHLIRAQEIEMAKGLAASCEVNETEVRIVKRILKSICDPELFTKFGFEKFFRHKLNRNTAEIAVDLETAQLKIVIGCLKAVSEKQHKEIKPLLDYAIYYFPNHLQNIDLALADPGKKCTIGKMLLSMFTDSEIIGRWWTEETLFMRSWWLYNDHYVDTVLSWFKDSAVVKGFPDDSKSWIKSLTSNSKPDVDLLGPIAKFVASKWLQDPQWWEVNGLFSWVYGYITKLKSRKDPDNVSRLTNDPSSGEVKASNILEAAGWAAKQLGVDQPDYEWVRSCARTCREYKNFEEAVTLFKTALILTSDNSLAVHGLALTYADQKMWQLAIQTLEPVVTGIRAGDARGASLSIDLASILGCLAEWHKELGEENRAMELYNEILEEQPEDSVTIFNIMALLNRQRKFAEMIRFLQAIKLRRVEKTGLNLLTQIYHDHALSDEYHEIIIVAARNVSNWGFIKESYQTAIDAARAKQEVTKNIQRKGGMIAVNGVLSYYFALALFQYHVDVNERIHAIDLWEHTMNLRTSTNSTLELQWAQYLSAKNLSSIYLERARGSNPESEIAAQNIKKLAQLSIGEDLKMDTPWLSRTDTKLLLARYYHLLDPRDERARDHCRSHIKIALELLSDEDPTNDWQGYSKLANALMFYGDDQNSLAAWSLLGPYDRVSYTESDDVSKKPDIQNAEGQEGAPAIGQEDPTSPLHLQQLEGPLGYRCDGRCGVTWTFADDIYVCKDCLDVQFERNCWNSLRSGQLGFNVCNKNHQFLHVPKYDPKEVKNVGKENVRVGNEVMAISKWLDGIKQDWGVLIEEDHEVEG